MPSAQHNMPGGERWPNPHLVAMTLIVPGMPSRLSNVKEWKPQRNVPVVSDHVVDLIFLCPNVPGRQSCIYYVLAKDSPAAMGEVPAQQGLFDDAKHWR